MRLSIRGSVTRTVAPAVFTALGIVALPCHAATCDELAAIVLPDATITLVEIVDAGAFNGAVPPRSTGNPFADLPSFCRVAATLTPSADSSIGIETWLPLAGWNRKLLGVGNGGWTGSIAYDALADGLRRGYATVSTDTGHTGGSASFALGHPEKLLDFAERATHEMTLAAKQLTERFYDTAPRYSYFAGCSAGGRQGMIEAQRYPDDYDGIVAGSPGLNWTGRALQTVWVGQAVQATAGSAIPPAKFPVLHAAATAACDADDGVVDGVIGDPRRCDFDPVVLQCQAGDDIGCLTSAQVETARRIYAPVMDEASGDVIVPGLAPGSEPGWSTMAGARPFGPGADLFRYVVYQDADWDFTTFDFGSDVAHVLDSAGLLDALNTDLGPYFASGGKLLSYHGWGDPQISPGSTLQYYEQVLAQSADDVLQYYRLFMVPGMNHCGGGPGTANFDMLSALELWVEDGIAPDNVPAFHVENGTVTRSRPLCPHPRQAVYDGTGNVDAATSFQCR